MWDVRFINANLDEQRRKAARERLVRRTYRPHLNARASWRCRCGAWLIRWGLRLQGTYHSPEVNHVPS